MSINRYLSSDTEFLGQFEIVWFDKAWSIDIGRHIHQDVLRSGAVQQPTSLSGPEQQSVVFMHSLPQVHVAVWGN